MPVTTFNWGIVGTGKIAVDFASQIVRIKDASVHSIYSRKLENALRFGGSFSARESCDSYEQMLNDKSVHAVYIAVPAALHAEYCTRALRAGKPVLCEKPFSQDLAQAEEIISVSQQEKVFCMEAMWMRFSPQIRQLRRKILDEELGKIRNITIQVGNTTPLSRLTDADPGRGALLNFGVYGVSLIQMLLGDPDTVQASIIDLENGLDETCVVTLCYPDALCTVTASIRLPMNNEAVITGTRGRARIAGPFFSPGFIELSTYKEPVDNSPVPVTVRNKVRNIDKIPFLGLAQGAFWATLLRRRGSLLIRKPGDNGLKLEALEVMRCVRGAKTESDIMPLRDTLSVAKILDQARGGSC